MLILLNTRAKMNLLPLLYYRQNKLLYILLNNMNLTVYNSKSLALIRVTEEWIYIKLNKIKFIFFIINNKIY
jgi:hypothetical protein